MTQEFGDDLRLLGRRGLLGGVAAASFAPSLVRAAVPEVVMCNWGGDAMKAFNDAFVGPYATSTGGKLVLDGSGPTNGKIRAMVEAKNVSWDLCDSGVTGLAELATRNLLAPIDYTVVDKSKVEPAFAYEYGVCNYMFSSVMAWDTTRVKGTPTMADFFDLKKIPGKRMIRKDSQAMIEMALVADGVPIDKLYPMDVDRAIAKFQTIKDSILTWDTGAQSQSLLRDGEVSMGWLWHTRATLLKREPNSKIDWNFTGGVLQPGLWVVPKGNPAGKQAMMAIASMQDPANQVKLLSALGNGPANPKAAPLVPEDLRSIDPGYPSNAAVQSLINADWYHDNHGKTFKRFLDFLSA
ncbi:ABC transporter substrate-binding protein [Acidisphaera sp. L21]|jgi:putative spermidine/putrescine transport system substrate-binding protein|uniref:ABC transporter substrate-binding protein n=1 Tax=Acidisphaera sp. L21 TaxID=1641851 RepID=UPI00131DAB5D|nr:ABC transporter substrate-binding protein [Acidisphaera sp. L21]